MFELLGVWVTNVVHLPLPRHGHPHQALDIVLLSFQPRREAPEPSDTTREEEQMVFRCVRICLSFRVTVCRSVCRRETGLKCFVFSRMRHLKEEMEILVGDLECNNSVIERWASSTNYTSQTDSSEWQNNGMYLLSDWNVLILCPPQFRNGQPCFTEA